ncbi:MAG TPA: GPW/gp25 family protein [Flavobacteriaceae bacterium]|nr:GPW/gp25 family protein [Flavobacteriaceae bacterium]MCB9213520.1 GPW/gp25 family protein [Alteromonas sp.]HPF10746.1 GPW/gp25 family protein [Flavobacteriaceae bacterium]HQU21546.1 GPW/gp25 family protein [Flavobacteriaceae bacterium]HQU65515.1 GPW/gp25 family protein [Flavobacteriaceae bacterium]
MYETIDFLGEGWSFPPHFDKKTGALVTTTDVVDINKSLHILLSTRLGERIMVPEYGCNLEELLFQPLDVTLKTYIKDLIETAILYHEPRIEVQKITLDSTNELEGEILIEIDYIIRVTNSRANMVFPFYKKEGSEL